MKEITEDEHNRIQKANLDYHIKRGELQQKMNALKFTNVFTCVNCKKKFEGEGHRTDVDESVNKAQYPMVCDNCVDEDILSVILIPPTQKELEEHEKKDRDEWFRFRFDLKTNKGTINDKNDVLNIMDETGRKLFHIDFGNGFRIVPHHKVKLDKVKSRNLILQYSPESEAIRRL